MTTALKVSRVAGFFARTRGDPLAQHHLGSGLGRRAARGAVSTVATQWSRFLLQTASTVVLARLLTPSDYGLVGMVTALIGVGDALWNLGLQTATVQRKEITHRQVTFFFWLQLLLGTVLTLLTCAAAPLIVGFYHRPSLYPIVYAYSVCFVLGGALAQHRAVLSRQMRFALNSVIDVIGLVVGSVAAVIVAIVGGAYWAIVVQTLVMLGVQAAMYWYCSGWRPSRPRWEHGMWPLVSFGVNLSLTNMLAYVGQNADNVLIGKVYGAVPLGIYSRAYNLLLLPARQVQAPVGRVAVPVLSFLQDQPERYRRYYHAAASGLCYIAMPLMTTLAALAPEVVDILLGPRWKAVAPIFRILAIAGVFLALRNPNGWIFTSTGHTGRQVVWAAFSQPVLVASFFVGIHWGVAGVAWAFTIATLAVLIPAFIWAVRDTPLTLRDVWGAGWRPLFLSGCTYLAAFGVHRLLHGFGSFVIVLAGGVAALAVLAAAYLAWPAVHDDINQLRDMLVRGRRGGGALSERARTVPDAATAAVRELPEETASSAS